MNITRNQSAVTHCATVVPKTELQASAAAPSAGNVKKTSPIRAFAHWLFPKQNKGPAAPKHIPAPPWLKPDDAYMQRLMQISAPPKGVFPLPNAAWQGVPPPDDVPPPPKAIELPAVPRGEDDGWGEINHDSSKLPFVAANVIRGMEQKPNRSSELLQALGRVAWQGVPPPHDDAPPLVVQAKSEPKQDVGGIEPRIDRDIEYADTKFFVNSEPIGKAVTSLFESSKEKPSAADVISRASTMVNEQMNGRSADAHSAFVDIAKELLVKHDFELGRLVANSKPGGKPVDPSRRTDDMTLAKVMSTQLRKKNAEIWDLNGLRAFPMTLFTRLGMLVGTLHESSTKSDEVFSMACREIVELVDARISLAKACEDALRLSARSAELTPEQQKFLVGLANSYAKLVAQLSASDSPCGKLYKVAKLGVEAPSMVKEAILDLIGPAAPKYKPKPPPEEPVKRRKVDSDDTAMDRILGGPGPDRTGKPQGGKVANSEAPDEAVLDGKGRHGFEKDSTYLDIEFVGPSKGDELHRPASKPFEAEMLPPDTKFDTNWLIERMQSDAGRSPIHPLKAEPGLNTMLAWMEKKV